MGSSASQQQQQQLSIAKSQQQLKKDAHQMSKSDPVRWQELKKRQAKLMDRLELSGVLGQPLERVEFIIQYLENKGVFVEAGLLGQGGCGFILKAFNEKEEKLAVKMLKCTSKDQIKENKQEYAVLNQFHSEFVTKVYDQLQFEFDSSNYMVIIMERCAYDLRKYIQISKQKNKLPGIRELLKMAEQMVQGLIVLHSKNIIHLDIKPANILFGLDKVWKYADLGVSRTLANDKQHISHLNGYTAVYSSPEQYQLMQFNASCKITKKSDIYSLGIVFMELTGAEVEKKWLVQQKTQSKVLTEEALNGEFPEFNERVIIPMVKYNHEERIELDQLLVIIQDMLEGKVRPVNTNLTSKEEEKISLPDQDDPLNFDSHKYKQIQMQYKAERKHMRNSMGAAPEGLQNDNALKQLMQQQAQSQGQQQQQMKYLSEKKQFIMLQNKDQKPSEFLGPNQNSIQLKEGSSQQIENHPQYQPEQQYYLTNSFDKNRGVSPGFIKNQIQLGSSSNHLQKQYSMSHANLPPSPQAQLPVLKLANKNNRPQSDYYMNQSSNNGSNNYERTSSNPPGPQYNVSSKSTNVPSFFSSKSIKFNTEINNELQQQDNSTSYQNNSFSSPYKSIRKANIGQETTGDLPRRSMYGKQVFLQNPTKQQQKSYFDSRDNSRTHTHPDEEEDNRIGQILPQMSLQGRQTYSNNPMTAGQFENKQTNEPTSLHMMKQQSQLAMIAQMQLFQNYQRSGDNHNQIANPVLRIFN